MPWPNLLWAIWFENLVYVQVSVMDTWLREAIHQRRQAREWPRARVLRDEEVRRLLAD